MDLHPSQLIIHNHTHIHVYMYIIWQIWG